MTSVKHQFTVEGGKQKQKGKDGEIEREMDGEREKRVAGKRRKGRRERDRPIYTLVVLHIKCLGWGK